jgi:chromosomal replication initiation ATPase DnaA
MQIENKFTIKDLKNLCKLLEIDYNALVSKSQLQLLVYQRFIIINYIRNNYPNTLVEIGKIFNRDHTTIKYALDKYKDEKKYNHFFIELAGQMESKFKRLYLRIIL